MDGDEAPPEGPKRGTSGRWRRSAGQDQSGAAVLLGLALFGIAQ